MSNFNDNAVDIFGPQGTLIGSYRHHQFTPWDLDLDVFVLKKDREKLLKGYKSLDKKLFDLHNDPVW